MSNVTENTTASGAADKPEALRLAEELMIAHMGHSDEGPSTFSEAADELRRLHALAVADADRILAEWCAYKPAPLQQGEYLPPPEPDTHCYDEDTGKDVWSHSAEQMRAYVDAHLAARGAAQAAQDPMLECSIQPRPLSHPLAAYHSAMSKGPLHYTWQDKPHRLVYDLIAAVKHYANQAGQAAPAPVAEDAEDGARFRAMVNAALNEDAFEQAMYAAANTEPKTLDDFRALVDKARAQAAQPEGGA